ncbi:MAG: hypothetical protein PUA90_03520 [bacterium]|nr:hypothetical protein [bacterium]
MYKYKKNIIRILTCIYVILSIIEFIKYFFVNSNLFGLIYLIINIFIIFLLVTVAYNYNRYYSIPRISKLIMAIVLGIFSSYILKDITINNMNYTDASIIYNNKIFITKNILKVIVYFLLTIFTIFEFKLDKLIKNITVDNKSTNKNTKRKKSNIDKIKIK